MGNGASAACAVLGVALALFGVAAPARGLDVVACGGAVAFVARDGSVQRSTRGRRAQLVSAADVGADTRGAIPELHCAGRFLLVTSPRAVRAVTVDGASGSSRRIDLPPGFVLVQSVPIAASRDSGTVVLGVRADERAGPPSLLLADLERGQSRVVALGASAVEDAPAPPGSHAELDFAFIGATTRVAVLLGSRALMVDAARATVRPGPRLPTHAVPLCVSRDGGALVAGSTDGRELLLVGSDRSGSSLRRVRVPFGPGRFDRRSCAAPLDGSSVFVVRTVAGAGVELLRVDRLRRRVGRIAGLAAPPALRHLDVADARVLSFAAAGAQLRTLDGGATPGRLPSAPEGWRWVDGAFGEDGSRIYLVASRTRGVQVERALYEVQHPAGALQLVAELR